MKAEDLKSKTLDELKKMLMDLRKDQFNARMQRAAGQLENTAMMCNIRRDVAKVKTFISKQLNKNKAA
jgi:large subunit ribosomal protein L29